MAQDLSAEEAPYTISGLNIARRSKVLKYQTCRASVLRTEIMVIG